VGTYKLIAIISSTIFPPDDSIHDGQRTLTDADNRLAQTQRTVHSLLSTGIKRIYIADNSGRLWKQEAAAALEPAILLIYEQHQFKNRGVSELYLLLKALNELPSGIPILKISGRYQLKKTFAGELGEADFVVKYYRKGRHKPSISTRCYLVKDKDTYQTFLQRTLRELYGYPSRVVGQRSLLRIVRNSLFPARDVYPYDDPTLSIEGVASRVLQIFNYRVNEVPFLGVSGYVRGNPSDLIIE